MRVRLHLRPGQRGTKQLLEQYGEQLVCVRYRYDAQRKKRYKTVELIIDVIDWEPPRRPDSIVQIEVAFEETQIQDMVRAAGGSWNRPKHVWELRYDQVLALNLADRIVDS